MYIYLVFLPIVGCSHKSSSSKVSIHIGYTESFAPDVGLV